MGDLLLITLITVCVLIFSIIAFGVNWFYRRRPNVNVNCWFCCAWTKVAYDSQNAWTCPKCEQYNGFTADGDYNKELSDQFQEPEKYTQSTRSNGLCRLCNNNVNMKVRQLAMFQPLNEQNWEAEAEQYTEQLERAYKLCNNCQLHVNVTLHKQKQWLERQNDTRPLLTERLRDINFDSLKQLLTPRDVIALNTIGYVQLALVTTHLLLIAYFNDELSMYIHELVTIIGYFCNFYLSPIVDQVTSLGVPFDPSWISMISICELSRVKRLFTDLDDTLFNYFVYHVIKQRIAGLVAQIVIARLNNCGKLVNATAIGAWMYLLVHNDNNLNRVEQFPQLLVSIYLTLSNYKYLLVTDQHAKFSIKKSRLSAPLSPPENSEENLASNNSKQVDSGIFRQNPDTTPRLRLFGGDKAPKVPPLPTNRMTNHKFGVKPLDVESQVTTSASSMSHNQNTRNTNPQGFFPGASEGDDTIIDRDYAAKIGNIQLGHKFDARANAMKQNPMFTLRRYSRPPPKNIIQLAPPRLLTPKNTDFDKQVQNHVPSPIYQLNQPTFLTTDVQWSYYTKPPTTTTHAKPRTHSRASYTCVSTLTGKSRPLEHIPAYLLQSNIPNLVSSRSASPVSRYFGTTSYPVQRACSQTSSGIFSDACCSCKDCPNPSRDNSAQSSRANSVFGDDSDSFERLSLVSEPIQSKSTYF